MLYLADAMARQNDKMEKAYRKIAAEISEDEVRQTVNTLGKIRAIIKDTE